MGTGRTPQQPTLPPRYDAPSYNAVYHGRVDTYRQSPVDVYLLKEEYSGSAAELRLAQEPVEEQASESGAEEMAPLRPRKGTVRLHASEKDVIRDVYSDEAPWRVRIEIGGVVDVVGPVRKRLRTTSDDMLSPEPLELKWNDGLGPLQNVSFTEESGSAYSDRRSIIGWIIQMLAATGLDLDVAAATEWYTPGMSGSACPLEQEYVDGARFVDEEGDPLTCYEVLEDLVREKKAFLCQERGQWHVYQRSLFRKSTFDRWVYPDGWTEQDSSPSAESYDAQIEVSSSFDARLKGSESPARPAYSGVAVTYEHRAIDNALRPWGRKYRGYSDAGDYTTERELFWTVDDWGWTYGDRAWGPTFPPNESSFSVDDGPFSGWVRAPVRDYDDSKTVEETLSKSALAPAALFESQRVKLAVPVYVDEGGYDCLSYAKLTLDGDDGTTYYLKRQVQADGDSYTYGDPSWTTDASAFVAFIVEQGREQDVSVTAPPMPADGALQVEMYGLIDPSPETVGRPSYKMALPALSPTAGGGQATSTTREALATGRTASDIYDVTVLHGTGPTGAHAAATREGSSDTAPLADDWKVGVYTDEEPTGLSAAALWAREALYQLSTTRDVLRWTLIDERPSLTRAARLPSGAVYLPLHTKTRYKEGHQAVEAVRLRRDTTVSYSLVERTDESGAGGGAGSSGSTSGTGGTGGSGSGTWPVSGTPDDIFSRSGEGGTVTLANTDITGALDLLSSDFLEVGGSDLLTARVKDEDDLSSNSDTHLATQRSIKAYVDTSVGDQVGPVAQGLVQTQAEIESLGAVTARKARKIGSGPNVQRVGALEDARVSLVPKPTFDQAVLNNQADSTSEAVRADRSLTGGENVKDAGNLTEDPTIELVAQPTFRQVTLNEQANAAGEAVRADRTVEVQGTADQIGVNATRSTQGDLTEDVSVKLQTPQNIHEGADFRVDQLRVGTESSPGTAGGAHFKGTIQHPQWNKGLEHWGMTPSGELDARLIEVDELIAKAFTAEITQSLAGSDVLTLSAADLASDFSVPAPSDGYVTDALHIENVGEAGAQAAFRDGDTVRLRIIDRSGGGLKVLDVWGTVKNYTDQENGTQKWDFETAPGTRSGAYGSTINKGSRVLDYGKSGDTIIQRTVLGSLSPFDRTVQWYDTDNDGVPDSYDILTQTGNIAGVGEVDSGLSKPGYYGSVARFTGDVVVGDLDAARSGSDGSYLKFTESEGLEIVVSSGDVETQITSNAADISANASDIGNNSSRITDNEADLRLLAQRIVQEQEARAGISLDVGENSAEIAIQAEILADNGITAKTNITSRVETVETDTGSNTTAINNLESIVGDGQNLAEADLTLTAEQNTTDISTNSTAISSLESIVGDGSNLAKADLTLTAVQNTEDVDTNSTAISSLESIVGDGQNLAEADLTLTAEQNTSDIGTNSSAISTLESQVGSGSIDAASSLTLAANQNTQKAEDNASAISTLKSQVGTGDITAASSLTLAANQNTADLKLLAQYITQESEARAGLEATVNENSAEIVLQAEILADNGITANTNITQRVSDDEALTESNASILDSNGLTSSSNITQRVTDAEAELDLTVRYDDSGAGVLVEANDEGTAITLDADMTLVGKLEGPSGEYEINLDTGTFLLNQGSIADAVTIGAVDASLIRKGNLTYRQGMEAGASDWSKGASGHTAQFVNNPVWSGSVALSLYSSRSTSDSASGGTTDGYYVEIPTEIALEYGGRTVEVTVWAKQDTADAFAVAYSTADVGNSGWQSFFPTSNWQPYRFTYEVPEPSGGGSDYLGLLGDATNNTGATIFDAITIRPQTEEISGFTIREDYLVGDGFFSGNGSVGAGVIGRSPDLYGFRVENTSDSLGRARMYIDADDGPAFDVVRDVNNQFNITSTAGSNDDEFQLKLIAGGTTVLQAGVGGTFVDDLDLKDLTIKGTLLMGTGGEITDDAATTNYKIDSDGVDFRATDSARASATEVTWLEPDLTGTVRGEIYAHNQEMNIASYRFGSSNNVQTTLTAYDRPKSQDPKEYARIDLNAEQYDDNEVNLVITGSGEFNIRNADVGGVVFDFDPFDWYMGFKEVYNFDNVPGGSPPTPTDGLRLYAKDQFTGNDVPYLWFVTEDGTQYRIDATPIT